MISGIVVGTGALALLVAALLLVLTVRNLMTSQAALKAKRNVDRVEGGRQLELVGLVIASAWGAGAPLPKDVGNADHLDI